MKKVLYDYKKVIEVCIDCPKVIPSNLNFGFFMPEWYCNAPKFKSMRVIPRCNEIPRWCPLPELIKETTFTYETKDAIFSKPIEIKANETLTVEYEISGNGYKIVNMYTQPYEEEIYHLVSEADKRALTHAIWNISDREMMSLPEGELKEKLYALFGAGVEMQFHDSDYKPEGEY